MRTYTINEAIEEMKDTVQVFIDGYGTWKVKANIGIRSTGEYAEDYFTTHDEEWKTGVFDGEKYNTYANSDQAREDSDSDAEYEEWRDAVISDSANEDNYESPDERDERAARKIIESWVEDGDTPDNVVVTADNSTIYVLDNDETEFAESETANLAMLVDGRGDAFINAYNNRDEDDA